jgi:flavin reductase (DIM6/NTAB) family NADH-FMN oxidoreductase RutF
MSELPDGRSAGAPVSEDLFRETFRDLAAGVVVVTSWVDGRPWGMTINSCCSISTAPARVLISVQRGTRTQVAIDADGSFGLNLLAADQKEVAESAAVAGGPKFIDEFCAPRRGEEPPAIKDSMWFLQCAAERVFEVGDHRLIIGRVAIATRTRPHGEGHEPLLYFNRTYRLIGQQL